MESIKDWVLSKLEELAPEMWADPAFALRTVRKSMRLEDIACTCWRMD